jgi:hypothetical protein
MKDEQKPKPEPPIKTAKCMCPYQKEKDACHPDCLMFKALKEKANESTVPGG